MSLRKSCTVKSGGGLLFGSKQRFSAPVNWKIETCGSVNFSLVRVGDYDGTFLSPNFGKDPEDIRLRIDPKPTTWNVETNADKRTTIAKKLLSLPVEYDQRSSAINEIICRARATNEAIKKNVDAFDNKYNSCIL